MVKKRLLKINTLHIFEFFILCCLLVPIVHAQTFNSGNKTVALFELYTSQGCSSCPVAEHWLARLKDDQRLWNEIVPLAFHVDYWDKLGWSDVFADARFSQRQYRYREQGGIRSVYTPGFVLRGKEWRDFFSLLGRRKINTDHATAAPELALMVNGKDYQATLKLANDQVMENSSPLVLHIALLGFDIKTQVPRGENRGKTLRQDFVVLAYQQYLANQAQWQSSLPKPITGYKAKAIAAWVSRAQNQTPLQAVGGWL